MILLATHTMFGPTDFGGFRFNLPLQPTLVERGLETPLKNHFVVFWMMTKHIVFRQLRQAYEDRNTAEHSHENMDLTA